MTKQYEKSFPDGSSVQVALHDDQVVFAQTSQGTYGRGAAIISPADARELADVLHSAADAAEAFVGAPVAPGAPLPGQPGGPAAGIGDLVAQLGGTAGLERLLAAAKASEAPTAPSTPPASGWTPPAQG